MFHTVEWRGSHWDLYFRSTDRKCCVGVFSVDDAGAHLTDRDADPWTPRPFPRRTESRVFPGAAAERSGWPSLPTRGGGGGWSVAQCYDRRRWRSPSSSRSSPVCFAWRNEAGGGETPQRRWAPAKHRRILALLRCSGLALHRICCAAHRVFCKVHSGNAARLRTPPPPDVRCCCHDRQRSPLDRGSAGRRRGGLIRAGGSHLRMLLLCAWSLL